MESDETELTVRTSFMVMGELASAMFDLRSLQDLRTVICQEKKTSNIQNKKLGSRRLVLSLLTLSKQMQTKKEKAKTTSKRLGQGIIDLAFSYGHSYSDVFPRHTLSFIVIKKVLVVIMQPCSIFFFKRIEIFSLLFVLAAFFFSFSSLRRLAIAGVVRGFTSVFL